METRQIPERCPERLGREIYHTDPIDIPKERNRYTLKTKKMTIRDYMIIKMPYTV